MNIDDIAKWRTWSHTYDNACMDGTLEVKVKDATKVGRVLISDDKHRGGLYYPDEDEGDLISRQAAIEAIEIVDWYHQNSNKDMVHGANDDEHQAWYKADDVYKALEAVPSADRPRGEWIYWRENGIKRCKCSRCLTSYGCLDTPYCPNCGTKMVGERRDE